MKLPEKHFYTIGDVTEHTGIKAHILRYWESQFSVLRPARRYSGHRKYTMREIDLINKIRYLVVDRKYTLAGASKEINRQINKSSSSSDIVEKQSPDFRKELIELKKEIDDCLQFLD